jgi:hypothetical protein
MRRPEFNIAVFFFALAGVYLVPEIWASNGDTLTTPPPASACAYDEKQARPGGGLVAQVKMEPGLPWCWAASATEIMAAHGKTYSECAVFTAAYRRQLNRRHVESCCAPTTMYTTPCIRTGWPDRIFKKYRFQYLRLNGNVVQGDAGWDVLTKQIDTNHPLIFARRWPNGGFHTQVLVGYQIPSAAGCKKKVEFHDHVNNDLVIEDYDDIFLHGPGGMGWSLDREWIDINPLP